MGRYNDTRRVVRDSLTVLLIDWSSQAWLF